MNLKRLFTCLIFAAVVAFASVWSFERWDAKPSLGPITSSQSADFTAFQRQMFKRGYARDHVTHRWYPIWESYTNNGCAEYGSPLETTFDCRTPLSGGIPDEEGEK
jgi:hypothetical protein